MLRSCSFPLKYGRILSHKTKELKKVCQLDTFRSKISTRCIPSCLSAIVTPITIWHFFLKIYIYWCLCQLGLSNVILIDLTLNKKIDEEINMQIWMFNYLKQYKRVSGSLFRLENNKYQICDFKTNITYFKKIPSECS